MSEEKNMTINFQVTEGVVKVIDAYAKLLGLSRSQMLRNLVYSGLADAKVMKMTGVLDVVSLIRSMNLKPGQIPQLDGF